MKGRKPIIVNNIQGISGRGKNSFHGAANKWQNKFMLLSRPNIDILVIFIFFHILSCLHVLHAIKSDVMNIWFFLRDLVENKMVELWKTVISF